jgi:outer membrane protein
MSKERMSSWVRLSSLFLFSFLIISTSNFCVAKELKVGVVDVESIYAAYGKAKVSAEQIQDKREEKQIELSKKQVDLQVLVDKYNKEQATLSEEERQKKLKEIRDLRTEIITFTRLSNENLTAENRKVVQARLNEISAVVQDYAKKSGFDLVIDKKSLPFFSDALNITDEIIKLLNK